MSKNEFMTLSEFRRISGLSHAELNRLLELGRLPVTVDEARQLRLLSSEIDPQILALDHLETSKPYFVTKRDLLEEVIASSITQALDSIVDEAVELALSWQGIEKQETTDPDDEPESA